MKFKLFILLVLFSLYLITIFNVVNSEVFNEFQANDMNGMEGINEELGGDEWKSPYKKREDARFEKQQEEMRRLTGYATTGKNPTSTSRCYGIKCPSGYTCNHEGVCMQKCGRVWCIVSTACEKDTIGIKFCRPPHGAKKV